MDHGSSTAGGTFRMKWVLEQGLIGEVAWLAVGIVVALLAWLFTLLVPGGKGEGG